MTFKPVILLCVVFTSGYICGRLGMHDAVTLIAVGLGIGLLANKLTEWSVRERP